MSKILSNKFVRVWVELTYSTSSWLGSGRMFTWAGENALSSRVMRKFATASTHCGESNVPNKAHDPEPYVARPYSYAFGRSRNELIFDTIGGLLDKRLATDDGRQMFVSHHEGIKRTFTQFAEDVNKVANCLSRDLGLQHGDVVGLWSCNTYDWVTVQYACARLGIILCTINPYYQAKEFEFVLRRADVKALFMPGLGSVQEQINQYGTILVKALRNGDENEQESIQLRHLIALDGTPYQEADIAANGRKIKVHSLEKLKANKNADLDSSLTNLVSPEDPAIIMFTSGTTGKPKGALLSQFTITNNANIISKNMSDLDQISLCCPLPFFHSFAASLGCISMVTCPFQLVIPYMRHDAKQIVEAINENKSTHLIATPTLVIDLLDYIRKKKVQIPSLQTVLAGGSSMPVEIAHQFVEKVPSCTDFRIGYGATELGPASTGCRSWYTFEQRTETIGTPLDFVEIKLVDPTTKRVVKLGETGEIYSRGFNTMLGYWKEPEKTAEAIDKAGWYNTGDLGVMDHKGFLKIIGRTKELIIVGGENVYPREIEELLHTHPSIMDAHVIGVPDARKGEQVCAWVKLATPQTQLSEDELRKFCQDNLAYFKVPKYIMFVDSFPVTTIGKAKKFEMREITINKLALNSTQ